MALNEGKLTQAGLRLMAKVESGATVKITRFAVGDGEIGSRDPLTLTDLVNRLYNYDVARVGYNSNVATVTFNFTNQSVTTGFYWREVGMWAQDPDAGEILFMYANASGAPEYIPPGGSSTILERQFNWRLVGSNAASITAQIDQSLMYASQDDLAALAKQSLQVHSVDSTYTALSQMRLPGTYDITQISSFTDRPITTGSGASGSAMLFVKKGVSSLTEYYDLQQIIEIAGRNNASLFVFTRRIRVFADGTVNPGPWIRDINAGGGTFVSSVQMNGGLIIETIDLTVNSKVVANGGIEAPGGIKTTSSMLVNGLANFTGSVQIGTGNSNAPAPSLALTLGDGDTGFNPGGDGVINLYSNGEMVAYVTNSGGSKGLFAPTSDGTNTYHLANEIKGLKQSGADRKQELVSAINAYGGSASTSEDMSVLINKLADIASRRIRVSTITGAASGTRLGRPDENIFTIPAGYRQNINLNTGVAKVEANEGGGFLEYYVYASSGSTNSNRFRVYALDAANREVEIFKHDGIGRYGTANYTSLNDLMFYPTYFTYSYHKHDDRGFNSHYNNTINLPAGFDITNGIRIRVETLKDPAYPNDIYMVAMVTTRPARLIGG